MAIMPEPYEMLNGTQLIEIINTMWGEDEEGFDMAMEQVNVWLDRGDGVAVYRNDDLSHPEVGTYKLVSYGSPAAQLEGANPPKQLPDIGGDINWRYQLAGAYKGKAI